MCSPCGRWLVSNSIDIHMSIAHMIVCTFCNIRTMFLGKGYWGIWSQHTRPRVSAAIWISVHVNHEYKYNNGPIWTMSRPCGSLTCIVIIVRLALWPHVNVHDIHSIMNIYTIVPTPPPPAADTPPGSAPAAQSQEGCDMIIVWPMWALSNGQAPVGSGDEIHVLHVVDTPPGSAPTYMEVMSARDMTLQPVLEGSCLVGVLPLWTTEESSIVDLLPLWAKQCTHHLQYDV